MTQLQGQKGAKDEKTLKKCKFQCLLRMWRGGVHAVCSKWERHKLTPHAATGDFSLGVTYQRMSEARELREDKQASV